MQNSSFSQIIEKSSEQNKSNIYMLIGKPQQGKTKSVPEIAYSLTLKGLNVICFVYKTRNNKEHFKNKCRIFCNKNNIKYDNHFISVENYNKQITLTSPLIIISILNTISCNKIEQFIKRNPNYALIIDESDVTNLGIKNEEMISKREQQLKKLIENAKISILITATPHAHLYKETNINVKNKNVFFLEEDKDYIGFNNEKFKYKECCAFNKHKTQEYTKEQINELLNILNLEFNTYQQNNKFKSILINISTLTNDHSILMNQIKTINNKFIFTLINSNEDKFNIYFPNGNIITKKTTNDIFNYFYSETLEYPVIFIVGLMANRTIAFRNEISSGLFNINNFIYCPSMIYFCKTKGSKRPVDDIIQNCGRLCGLYPEHDANFSVRLYTTIDIINLIQNDICYSNKFKENVLEYPEKVINEVIPPYEINNTIFYPQTSKNKGNNIKSKQIGSKIYFNGNNQEIKQIIEKDEEEKNDIEDNNNWFKNNISRWIKANTDSKIALLINKIINHIKENGNKFTKEIIIDFMTKSNYSTPTRGFHNFTSKENKEYLFSFDGEYYNLDDKFLKILQIKKLI